MSYVEKAIYDYIKGIFVNGFKVLFSKKYIGYTILVFAIALTASFLVLAQDYMPELAPYADMMLKIELAVAVTFVICGLFLAHYPLKFWFIPALMMVGAFSILFYFLPEQMNLFDVSPYVSIAIYLIWIIVSVFLSYSMSLNLFGNKYLGSALYLGKSKNQGGILFGGIVFLIVIANIGGALYLLYNVITSKTMELLLFSSAIFSILASILVLLIIFDLGKRNDVFFTILAFYYVFNAHILWRIVIFTYQGRELSDSTFDTLGTIVTSLFWLIYSVSNFGKKLVHVQEKDAEIKEVLAQEKLIRKQDEVEAPHFTKDELDDYKGIEKWKKKRELKSYEKKKKKRDQTFAKMYEEAQEKIAERKKIAKEKWFILRIPEIIGPLGIMLTVMGLIMGYHVINIWIITNPELIIFDASQVAQLRGKWALTFVSILMFFFLFSYATSKKFRNYSDPDLYRFEILPSYEELMENIDKIREGEMSWQGYVMDMLTDMAKQKITGTAKTAYTGTKTKISGVFSRKKKK